MRRSIRLVAVLTVVVTLMTLIGCSKSKENSSQTVFVPLADFVPNLKKYSVNEINVFEDSYSIDDAEYSNVLYDIKLNKTDNITNQYAEDIANDIVKQVTSRYKVNVISVFLYDLENHKVASVDWAPFGSFTRGNEVIAGDYSTHEYSVDIPSKEDFTVQAYADNNTSTISSHYIIADAVLEDLSYDIPGSNLECVRVQYRIWIETDGKASRSDVEELASDLVSEVTSRFEINALSIFVYDGPDMYGSYSVASVDWAPYGDWGRADEVRTGDYSKHRYTINMR